MRVYLIGFMGAGKTYWGKLLGKKMSLPFYDLDDLIIQSEDRSVEKIFDESGEEYFREKEKEILYMMSESHENMLLSCGGGTPCYFNNIEYMNDMGVTVWINTPFKILLGRLRQQQNKRPLLKGLDDEQLQAYIVKKNHDRRIYYEQAKMKIEEQDIHIDDFIKRITDA